MRFFVFILLITSISSLSAQQKLTNTQEAWLYRIVEKTPVLQRNWQSYFKFDKAPFYRSNSGEYKLDYNAITYYQQHNPESLLINYDSIQQSSYGLLSEAAIKLTLWELNEELKKCIYHDETCTDTLLQYFKSPLVKLLPAKTKQKKKNAIINSLIHPSLPIAKKIEQLNDKHKLEATVQKQLLNKWSSLVAEYSHQRSLHFYQILAGKQAILSTNFLAAGEGSGTAGLLYESEIDPTDSTRTWYGRGIGLYTYKVRTFKNQVRLLDHLEQDITIPKNKSMALHMSLWGLNSSFKPMIIVSNDSVSYHLFADFKSKELSADDAIGEGISHIDRIEQYRTKKITKPLKALQKDGAIANNLNTEYEQKERIELQLSELGNEIDTLLKYDPENETAISYRKNQINTKLDNLNDKARRIKELEQKLRTKNASITAAEKKLDAMIELLGPIVQEWTTDGRFYTFNTGVVFDRKTQDLIFPSSHKDRPLSVRLLSASYTLEGKQKDEVQAYVSLTHYRQKSKPTNKTPVNKIDTIITTFFHPDEYRSRAVLDINHNLIQCIQSYSSIKYCVVPLVINDTLKSTSILYPNRNREYQTPFTIDGHNRQVQIQLKSHGDTLTITALASTDPVATRLSQVHKDLRSALGIKSTSTDNNRYLISLRALSALISTSKQLEIEIDINSINNQLQVNTTELQLIYHYLMQKY